MGWPSRAEQVKLLVGFYMISPDCHAVLSGLIWHGGSGPKEFADFDPKNYCECLSLEIGGDAAHSFDVGDNVPSDAEFGKAHLKPGSENILGPTPLVAELRHFSSNEICAALHTQFLFS